MAVGVGGSLISCGLLMTDCYFGKRTGQWLSAVLIVPIVAAVIWCLYSGHEFSHWWPLPVFASGFAVGALGYVENFESWVSRVLSPRIVWMAMLAVCLVCANLAATIDSRPVEPPLPNLLDRIAYRVSHDSLPESVGITDSGRVISLHRYDVASDNGDDQKRSLLNQDVSAADGYRFDVIRLEEPQTMSNCHGFVFADNRFALDGNDVDRILCDNGYQQVDQPQTGDVVVYRSVDQEVIHSGIVRGIGRVILVESKWGPLGVYIHRADFSPYGEDYGFFHAGRDSHSITLQDTGVSNEAPVDAR